jgi:predicted ATPase
MEANGSVQSIIDWTKNAKLDERQKRAFEIMTSCFVLTFYTDAFTDESLGRGQRLRFQPFLDEKKKLETLSDKNKRGSDQLILFLHGPGGCGKTTVIDLFIEYARESAATCNHSSFLREQ